MFCKFFAVLAILAAMGPATLSAAKPGPKDEARGDGAISIEDEISRARKALDEISARLETIGRPDHPREDGEAMLETLTERNRELASQNAELRKSVLDLEKARSRDQERIMGLEETRDSMRMKLLRENETLSKRLEGLEREREELMAFLEAERNVFKEMSERWKIDRRQLEEAHTKLTERKQQIEKEKATRIDATKLADKVRAQLVSEQIATKKLKSQLAQLKDKFASLEDQLEWHRNPPSVAPVLFTRNASESEEEFERVLREAKSILKRAPKAKFHIVGHTCNLGPADENLALSETRARLLADFLSSKGIAEEKITADGSGETSPAFPNDGEKNRAKNRRTEILVILPAG